MPDKDAAKIIQLLLADKSAVTVIAEGFPKSSVYDWAAKLEADPHAGDKHLARPGAKGGDKGNGTDELEAKSGGKETQLPPTFRFPVTVKLGFPVICFCYRAKANGYPGDVSAYINEGLRELYQLSGFEITTVFDAAKANELAAQYLLPEVEGARG